MRRRLLGAFLAVALVVVAVLVVPLGIGYAERQVERVKDEIERDAVVLAMLAEEGLEEGRLSPQAAEVARRYRDDTGARVVVTDERGTSLLDTDPPVPGARDFSTRPEVASALEGRIATGSRRSATLGAGFVYAAVPVASAGTVHGAVRVTYPTDEVDARVRRYWLTLGLVSLVTLAGAAVTGVVISRWVTRPLLDLRTSAAALGAGDLTARAATDQGPPEVREVAAAFNRTAERLEDLITSQDAFVADASHELRTPLTALRLRLEALEPEVGTGGSDDLEAAVEEVDRLSRLVQGLLALARADRADALASRQPVPVGPLLEDRRALWQVFADEHDVQVVLGTPPGAAGSGSAGVSGASDDSGPLAVLATPDRIAQVLDNLVANALDASPDGARIWLWAERHDGEVVLHVGDEGPGLDEAEREHAFDRFWRSGASRQELGGSGLGLAIVAKLVHADGGRVQLGEAPGGGVDARVVLEPAP